MSRLPLRLRLTLGSALVMAAVLAGIAFLLVHHLASSLDTTLNQGLRARAGDVAALVRQSDTGLRDAGASPVFTGGSVAQVLSARGLVVDATRGARTRPLLDASQQAHALRGPLFVGRVRRLGGDMRLLAAPLRAQDQRLVVVVGEPLANRDAALASLRDELIWVGPLTLLLTSLVAYLLATAAVRPVERMRRQAGSISERRLSERLPLPQARDELFRLGETLNAMLARIESGVANERRFVADASHELRTPLSLLRAEVELALEERRDTAELEAALRSIGEEADRLSQLTEDLLLLARLDEGRLPLRSEEVDVDALFAGVAARFERRARQDGRAIDSGAGGLRIRGDRLRVEQALGNLVENALRHGAGTIRLHATRAGDAVALHVADEGAGIPPDFLPRAFARFSRADDSRTRAGTGLGLAIVAEIAAAHGGAVEAGNRPEGGAELTLTVPSATPAPALVSSASRG
jgi:two-component system OmpR family sensor kinase